jgi:glycosyltransferase involved in cell wall biosynthesis
MAQPLVSICIPAYKKTAYVVRCIESVLRQSYKQVEVIISDDSPDEDIKLAIEPFAGRINIRYYRNQPALKTPRNWNAALAHARGEFQVLMHQDDWYHTPGALQQFLDAFEKHPEADFVFCRNTAVDEAGKTTILQARPKLLHTMQRHPNHLLLAQVIGPPSNTMLRRQVQTTYDERFIWLVDVDYYVRLLKQGFQYHYIDQHLVSIGLHADQATEFCRANVDIIFRENILFAGKLEPGAFRDVLIYDYYWRLLRNFRIRRAADVGSMGLEETVLPPVIRHMLHDQGKIRESWLRNGFISKPAMYLSYRKWIGLQ